MVSRRHIREAVVQFLYCADLEGGANPAELRGPFWDFVSESDRRSLHVATFRTVYHLAQGRERRIGEFVERQISASALLSNYPQAEVVKLELDRIAKMESTWSQLLEKLERLPSDDHDPTVAEAFSKALDDLFKLDHDLAAARSRFLDGIQDFPVLRKPLEAVAASIRRLQRISDRLRMVEEPEKFPEQADLSRLRDSKVQIGELRRASDELVDAILAEKETIDATLAAVVENFAPERIDPVDRAILRLGTYELIHAGVPPKVSINEAIELAKLFGTSDSRRFVNGILDKIAHQGTVSLKNKT